MPILREKEKRNIASIRTGVNVAYVGTEGKQDNECTHVNGRVGVGPELQATQAFTMVQPHPSSRVNLRARSTS